MAEDDVKVYYRVNPEFYEPYREEGNRLFDEYFKTLGPDDPITQEGLDQYALEHASKEYLEFLEQCRELKRKTLSPGVIEELDG